MTDFQNVVFTLNRFWTAEGCLWLPPLDLPMGAATFHPATFLRALDTKPWAAAYLQPCRRPQDGRYGENPNRGQHYFQYQVVQKPVSDRFQDQFLASLEAVGVDRHVDEIRFVEDNWESPTLGAWGLGWEVWLNGMEVAQITYFQQVGGFLCEPVMGEATYGLERLLMSLTQSDEMYSLPWGSGAEGQIFRYGDLFRDNEIEMSRYNFEQSDPPELVHRFQKIESEIEGLLTIGLLRPAYERVIEASHLFNLLDARHAISAGERQRYVLRVRKLAQAVAQTYRSQSG